MFKCEYCRRLGCLFYIFFSTFRTINAVSSPLSCHVRMSVSAKRRAERAPSEHPNSKSTLLYSTTPLFVRPSRRVGPGE